MNQIVRAEISRSALKHNYQQVKTKTNQRHVLAMVKANGYGHGLLSVAKALAPDALGVARLEEGLQLKEAGIKKPIVLMEGCFSKEALKEALANQFEIVLHAPYQIKLLEPLLNKLKTPCNIWLKLNTGMNRLGFAPDNFEAVWQQLAQHAKVQLKGMMTHFASAEEINHPSTLQQKNIFEKHSTGKTGLKSAANSAAILQYPNTHYDWVRPGLMLYGASPFAGKTGQQHNLIPAMRLVTQVIAIHDLAANQSVGYGATFKTTQPAKIAIAAIGYGDGYPWAATNQTPILVNGQRTHLAGRVSMDMIAINVTALSNVKLGDEVECWGPNLPIEKVASTSHTLSYELLTRLTSRVELVMTT